MLRLPNPAQFIVILACVAGPARAGDKDAPPPEILASKGLSRQGALMILKDEEARVFEQFARTDTAVDGLKHALGASEAVANIEAYQGDLTELLKHVRSVQADANSQRGKVPRPYAGTYAFRALRVDSWAWSGLAKDANAFARKIEAELKSLKSEAPAKLRQNAAAELERKRDEAKASLGESRAIADATLETYRGLADDSVVRKALESVNRSSKTNLKIGPSKAFRDRLKVLEKAEKAVKPETTSRPVKKRRK